MGKASDTSGDDAEETPGSIEQTARQSLYASAELLRALTLHSGDIISLLDAEGRLLYNSPATERINGFTPEELAHIDTFEMIHPDDRARVGEVFHKVLAQPGAVHTVQYRYLTKDQRWLWMEAIASNQLHNPAVRGVVANSRDISERIAADEERGRLQAKMLQVQKLESLGVLAGGVAHDFNNLLTVVLGEASALLRKNDDPEIKCAVTSIADAAERAADLTQLLLSYAGKGRLDIRPTCLTALVDGMVPLLRLTAGRQNHLHFQLRADPAWIQADARQLRQVILNLVQNAAESAGRPVNIWLEVGTCILASEQLATCVIASELPAGAAVYVRVTDDGAGMTAEAREKIFDPFFSTKQTGRGLGLAAVHGIVQGHKGALAVESEQGRGTAFTLYLPPTEQVADPLSDAQVRWTADTPGGHVLVVDDDSAAAATTCRLLGDGGFYPHAVGSGVEALAFLKARQRPLALVVLDMVMPGLDGAETFARLRQLDPELPLLLYSGYDGHIAAECLTEPRTAFLQKPFTADQLFTQVARLAAQTRTVPLD